MPMPRTQGFRVSVLLSVAVVSALGLVVAAMLPWKGNGTNSKVSDFSPDLDSGGSVFNRDLSDTSDGDHDASRHRSIPTPATDDDVSALFEVFVESTRSGDTSSAHAVFESLISSAPLSSEFARRKLVARQSDSGVYIHEDRHLLMCLLCISASDVGIQALRQSVDAVNAGGVARTFAEWSAFDKDQPRGVPSYRMLSTEVLDHSSAAVKALIFRSRFVQGADSYSDIRNVIVTLLDSASATVTDPVLSVFIECLRLERRSGNLLEPELSALVEAIRDRQVLSVRLRIEAATLVPPRADDVIGVLERFREALGNADAAAVLRQFMQLQPHASEGEWGLILGGLVQLRGRSDASAILFEAIVGSRESLFSSTNGEVLGSTLARVIVDGEGRTTTASLAREALYALVVGRNQYKRIQGRRTGDSRQVKVMGYSSALADELLRTMLERLSPDSVDPIVGAGRVLVATQTVRLVFELDVAFERQSGAIGTLITFAQIPQEKNAISSEALASLYALEEDTLIANEQTVHELMWMCIVTINESQPEVQSLQGLSRDCAALSNVARLLALGLYPALTEEQAAALKSLMAHAKATLSAVTLSSANPDASGFEPYRRSLSESASLMEKGYPLLFK